MPCSKRANNDGRDDIVISGYPEYAGDKESAYLIYGQDSLSSVSIDFVNFALNPTKAGIYLRGLGNSDGFGSAVGAAGDIDGDGIDDFMIGAPRRKSYNGEVYVIYGKSSGLANFDLRSPGFDMATFGFKVTGDTYGSYLGYSLSKAGKFHSKDYDDILIGVERLNDGTKKGAAIIIYGGQRSSLKDINFKAGDASLNPQTAGFSILGNAAGDKFGSSVSYIGDINGDGYDDVLIGAPEKDSSRGAAYVIYGRSSPPANSKIDLSDPNQALIPASTGFMITGNAAGDRFGCSVSSVGDINGDEIPDIIIGANGKESSRGAAYIIYGKRPAVNIDLSDSNQALTPCRQRRYQY